MAIQSRLTETKPKVQH